MVIDRGVAREVQRERGLSHARARRDDHELAGLEPAGVGVEVLEAGRHAGELAAAAHQHLDVVHRVVQPAVERREAGARLGLAELEDLRLGEVEQLARRARLCSKHASVISLDTRIRLRLTALSRTMRAWCTTLAAVAS